MKEFDGQLDQLLHRTREGKATARDVRELEQRLQSDPALRKNYLERMWMEEELSAAFRSPTDMVLPFELDPQSHNRSGVIRWLMGIAAVILALLFIGRLGQVKPAPTVAVLESRSSDTWSHPPTLDANSRITAGKVRLESGTARFRFDSGASVTLEGPASLIIETPMRARLMSGKALVEAPDSAKGFVLALPHGEAVDLGTRFSANVEQDESTCEVLEGAVLMRHDSSKVVERMHQGKAMAMNDGGIHPLDYRPSESFAPAGPEPMLLRTAAEATVISGRAREDSQNDRMLLVKMEPNSITQRRALFSIDLSEAWDRKIESARLNLNLVPSGLGFAAYLPDEITFAVYGITDESRETWSPGTLAWEDTPGYVAGREDMVNAAETLLLGKFVIPSGQQSGSCQIESNTLLEFLSRDTTKLATFLIVRETYGTHNESLVHAFAGKRNPEASGPSLEIIYAKQGDSTDAHEESDTDR